MNLFRRVLTLTLFAASAGAQGAGPRPTGGDRTTLLKSAEEALAAGRRVEAARLFRTAADRFGSVQALVHLARLQSGDGDRGAALQSIRQALDLAPNSEEVLFASAQLSLATRAPLPAILALEPLARMCPNVAQYHYLLGVAFLQAGDPVASVEKLGRAEVLEPNRPLTLVALGLALNTRKHYAEAKLYLERALERDPDNVEALAALAESEEGMGDWATAESHAQRALQKADDNATANLVMGMVLMKTERYPEARRALEKAVAADPRSPKAHYQLSLACARLNDPEAAQRHVEEYRRKMKDVEESLARLRTETGSSPEGMKP